MPVTFEPAKHPAEPFLEEHLSRLEISSDVFLTRMTKDWQQPRKVHELLQSSIPPKSTDTTPCTNGFVDTVIEAYNKHRALVVRPDDIWLAILTQFSIFVNNNAEALRASFVAHEGKKELLIETVGTRYTADFGSLAQQFTRLIDENVVDPSLREWILPDFATTRDNDTTTCSVVMMATMKAYFAFEISMECGLPRVTLEGAKDDWEKILQRLEKLKEYGIQTVAWYHLLRPIISRFVAAFDDPDSAENLDFWCRITHYKSMGSGMATRSGWITAFCVFNTGDTSRQHWQGDMFKPTMTGPDVARAASLSVSQFYDTYYAIGSQIYGGSLVLDGARYPAIDPEDVPIGFAEVAVKLHDNGTVFDTVMVAGSVGMKVSGERNEVVSPVSGWWIYIKTEDEDGEEEE